MHRLAQSSRPVISIPLGRSIAVALVAGLSLLALGGGASAASGVINAVGVENEYADVIAQIGGQYVHVSAIESDPNTDPHSFEASPRIAGQLAAAELVVENGLGYDDWADRIISAAPNEGRKLINVQHLLGLPDSTPNPHLWYDPRTMPAVAKAIAAELGALRPGQAAYFAANEAKFEASLKPWLDAIATFRKDHPATPIAVTEPVADYLLQALGADIRTPATLESAVMNDNDPSPQDISTQTGLLTSGGVGIFVYNQQVTDDLTTSFLESAKQGKVPVVGVYETMPTPGFTYQSWMLAEVEALDRAVTQKVSTEKLAAGQ
ncbi:MAG TPA: zinc ABC transporter substrate-binding protein [Devosia sp.]|nr:zinc ABC transporter substrate-binding protein [Devosia sp.]